MHALSLSKALHSLYARLWWPGPAMVTLQVGAGCTQVKPCKPQPLMKQQFLET